MEFLPSVRGNYSPILVVAKIKATANWLTIYAVRTCLLRNNWYAFGKERDNDHAKRWQGWATTIYIAIARVVVSAVTGTSKSQLDTNFSLSRNILSMARSNNLKRLKVWPTIYCPNIMNNNGQLCMQQIDQTCFLVLKSRRDILLGYADIRETYYA